MALRRRSYLLEFEDSAGAIKNMLYTLRHMENNLKDIKGEELNRLLSYLSAAIDQIWDVVAWLREHPNSGIKLNVAVKSLVRLVNDLLDFKNRQGVGS